VRVPRGHEVTPELQLRVTIFVEVSVEALQPPGRAHHAQGAGQRRGPGRPPGSGKVQTANPATSPVADPQATPSTVRREVRRELSEAPVPVGSQEPPAEGSQQHDEGMSQVFDDTRQLTDSDADDDEPEDEVGEKRKAQRIYLSCQVGRHTYIRCIVCCDSTHNPHVTHM
jgi:hypothetical protein